LGERSRPVFTREDGSAIHLQSFSEAFHQDVAEAKQTPLSLHGLRHTHATLALRAGVQAKVVSERLGHATVGFTLDTYTDSLPDIQEAAAGWSQRSFSTARLEDR
jgi:integrase